MNNLLLVNLKAFDFARCSSGGLLFVHEKQRIKKMVCKDTAEAREISTRINEIGRAYVERGGLEKAFPALFIYVSAIDKNPLKVINEEGEPRGDMLKTHKKEKSINIQD